MDNSHPLMHDLTHGRAVRTVLVADVVEYVRLMEQDEEGTVRRWKRFMSEAMASLLPAHGGSLVKSTGDGLVATFEAVSRGVQCAFAMHKVLRADNAGRPDDAWMCLRVGLDCGEVFFDELDVQGRTVNLAARLMTLAGPGETIVSAALRDRLTQGLDAEVDDLGECHLKHLSAPVRAYRLGEATPDGAGPPHERWCTPVQLRPVIAVVPFACQGADPRLPVLGEMVADEIINDLSRTVELQVISRLSASPFAGRPTLLQDVRTHLKANYLAYGACSIGPGERVRLHVELIAVDDGHVAWSDTCNASIAEALGAEAELAHRISLQIGVVVLQNELARAQTTPLPNLSAYSMLLGSQLLLHRFSRHDFERSRQVLEALVERVPRHAVPLAWLARWHDLKAFQGWSERPEEDRATALALCNRALEIDPDSSIALTVAGAVHAMQFKDLDRGTELLLRAIESNPNGPLAWLLLGAVHSFRGEGEAAVRASEQAMRLSPVDPMRFFFEALSASACLAAERYDEAIEMARRSLRGNRLHLSTYRVLAIAQVLSGREDGARRTVADMLRLAPTFTIEDFIRRSPGADYEIGQRFARALRRAGLPERSGAFTTGH